MFGKPGRPREDVFLRRLEIYTSVAPLLEKAGPRITMRQAAAAAHMSVGGIYHYFPSKRDLVLFVLSPEALERLCEKPDQLIPPFGRTEAQAHLEIFLDGLVRGVPFLRPAVLAAIELGAGPALDFVEATMNTSVRDFVLALRAVQPDMGDSEARAIDRVVRHATLGAMLDRSVSPAELRNELQVIVYTRPLARMRWDERQAAASF
jgi:AcrR family transcriptional regulator